MGFSWQFKLDTKWGKTTKKIEVNKKLGKNKMSLPFFSSGQRGTKILMTCLMKSCIHTEFGFLSPGSALISQSHLPKMLSLNQTGPVTCLFWLRPWSLWKNFGFSFKRNGKWLQRFQLVSNIKIEIPVRSFLLWKKKK